MRPERPGGGGNPYTRSAMAEPRGGLGGDAVAKPMPPQEAPIDYSDERAAYERWASHDVGDRMPWQAPKLPFMGGVNPYDWVGVSYDPNTPEGREFQVNSRNAMAHYGRLRDAYNGYKNPIGAHLIAQLQQQLGQMQAYGASPAEIAQVQMRLEQAMQGQQESRQRNVNLYGAGGGDNSYIANLIGMGAQPGQYQSSSRYATQQPGPGGAGPMRQR